MTIIWQKLGSLYVSTQAFLRTDWCSVQHSTWTRMLPYPLVTAHHYQFIAALWPARLPVRSHLQTRRTGCRCEPVKVAKHHEKRDTPLYCFQCQGVPLHDQTLSSSHHIRLESVRCKKYRTSVDYMHCSQLKQADAQSNQAADAPRTGEDFTIPALLDFALESRSSQHECTTISKTGKMHLFSTPSHQQTHSHSGACHASP